MIFFIGIFFILELFAVVSICYYIYKLDDCVNRVSELFQTNRHNLKFKLRALHDSVKDIQRNFERQKKYLYRKRQEMIAKILKGVLFASIFAMMKQKHKKKILLLELALILYDSYKADCAV